MSLTNNLEVTNLVSNFLYNERDKIKNSGLYIKLGLDKLNINKSDDNNIVDINIFKMAIQLKEGKNLSYTIGPKNLDISETGTPKKVANRAIVSGETHFLQFSMSFIKVKAICISFDSFSCDKPFCFRNFFRFSAKILRTSISSIYYSIGIYAYYTNRLTFQQKFSRVVLYIAISGYFF